MNKSEIAKQLGKLGGEATKKKYGKKHFSEAGKKGSTKRWGKDILVIIREKNKRT